MAFPKLRVTVVSSHQCLGTSHHNVMYVQSSRAPSLQPSLAARGSSYYSVTHVQTHRCCRVHQQSVISLEILESPFFKKTWFLAHLELL